MKINVDVLEGFEHLTPKLTIEDINEEFKNTKLEKQTSVFDVLKAFWDDDKWETISDTDKKNAARYINNRLLFLFPKKVMELNRFGVPELFIVEYWRYVMSSFFKKQPDILYTRIKKDEKDKKIEEGTPEYQIEQFEDKYKWDLIRREKIDRKSFDELVRRFPEKVLEELHHIKLISSNNYVTMKENKKDLEESFAMNYIETDQLALELLNDFMED